MPSRPNHGPEKATQTDCTWNSFSFTEPIYHITSLINSFNSGLRYTTRNPDESI